MPEQVWDASVIPVIAAAVFFVLLPAAVRFRRVRYCLPIIPVLAVFLGAAAAPSRGVIGALNALAAPAPLVALVGMVLSLMLLEYRFWTRPRWALVVFGVLVLAYAGACLHPEFRTRVVEPDAIPITLLLFGLVFVLWIAFRQASINDARLECDEPLAESDQEDRVTTWPHLVFLELIALVSCTALLIVWSILVRAPLEPPADPTRSPNPAKAPWYFVGLQELLVYFDPWIAGALVPLLIIVGLCALPYLDRNPEGNGYYTLKRRPAAIAIFLGAFVMLWVVPIVIGAFLRGPNWSVFGPFEPWDPLRMPTWANINLSRRVWDLLGACPVGVPADGPVGMLIREWPGLVFLGAYGLLTPWIAKRTLFRRAYAQMGVVRFAIMIVLFLMMMLIPVKMLLHWLFQIKYIVFFPEWSVNI